jgi:hypothetical protein
LASVLRFVVSSFRVTPHEIWSRGPSGKAAGSVLRHRLGPIRPPKPKPPPPRPSRPPAPPPGPIGPAAVLRQTPRLPPEPNQLPKSSTQPSARFCAKRCHMQKPQRSCLVLKSTRRKAGGLNRKLIDLKVCLLDGAPNKSPTNVRSWVNRTFSRHRPMSETGP